MNRTGLLKAAVIFGLVYAGIMTVGEGFCRAQEPVQPQSLTPPVPVLPPAPLPASGKAQGGKDALPPLDLPSPPPAEKSVQSRRKAEAAKEAGKEKKAEDQVLKSEEAPPEPVAAVEAAAPVEVGFLPHDFELRLGWPQGFEYDLADKTFSLGLEVGIGYYIRPWLVVGGSIGANGVGAKRKLFGVPLKGFAKAVWTLHGDFRHFYEGYLGGSAGSTLYNSDGLMLAGLCAGIDYPLGRDWSIALGPQFNIVTDFNHLSAPAGVFWRLVNYF